MDSYDAIKACAEVPVQQYYSSHSSAVDNESDWSNSLESIDYLEPSSNESVVTDQAINALVNFVFSQIVNPLICSFGIVGNILNVVILSRVRMQAAIGSAIERSSRDGLIGLAVADMLCCIVSLFVALFRAKRVLWLASDPTIYVLLYGPYFQNAFMKASTWLTVILAVERYLAICWPLHARYMVDVRTTRLTITFTFFATALLELPTIWNYELIHIPCNGSTQFYLLGRGPFLTARHLRTAFTYIWAVVGFLAPAAVLVYCNVHLVRALRESFLMGRLYRSNVRSSFAVASNRLTLTLISIVCMFLVLVTPSELLHLFFYAISDENQEAASLAIDVTNSLQTANFAFNFVLYCVVNVQFRETWKDVILCAAANRRNAALKCTGSGVTFTLQERPNDDL